MLKFRNFILSLIFLVFFYNNSKAANMSEYCYTPPTITTSVSPNVMLVIDVSGSMSLLAYDGTTYQGNEEGYFIPDKVYKYNSSQDYWEETTGTATTCPNSADRIKKTKLYAGSCLNFLYMTRIDLVRWAL
ncbi:conserved hypothetical protein, partial [Sulfurihydrogenibium yellowstonense SS-5]